MGRDEVVTDQGHITTIKWSTPTTTGYYVP